MRHPGVILRPFKKIDLGPWGRDCIFQRTPSIRLVFGVKEKRHRDKRVKASNNHPSDSRLLFKHGSSCLTIMHV